ncbi:hypothetical protein ACHAXS_001295 [Conticribra weissflogii]
MVTESNDVFCIPREERSRKGYRVERRSGSVGVKAGELTEPPTVKLTSKGCELGWLEKFWDDGASKLSGVTNEERFAAGKPCDAELDGSFGVRVHLIAVFHHFHEL